MNVLSNEDVKKNSNNTITDKNFRTKEETKKHFSTKAGTKKKVSTKQWNMPITKKPTNQENYNSKNSEGSYCLKLLYKDTIRKSEK